VIKIARGGYEVGAKKLLGHGVGESSSMGWHATSQGLGLGIRGVMGLGGRAEGGRQGVRG